MKKIIVIVLAVSSIFFLTVTKTLAEWSVGISLSTGVYEADGQENEDGEINKATAEEAQFSYPSLFVEYNIGRVSIGFDVIPGSLTTEEQARTDYNVGISAGVGNDGAGAAITNKVQVELSRHVSLYALVPITDIGAFARVQIMRVDVETKEVLGSGSTYPDTTMEGASLSLGYQHDTGGAAFLRAEVGYTDYEAISVTATNTSNKVDADVDGTWARISIGKTF
mgnify:CR=1 FL=1